MQVIGLFIQIVLVIWWYTVPSMMGLSAWIIFLPLILVGVAFVLMIAFMGISFFAVLAGVSR